MSSENKPVAWALTYCGDITLHFHNDLAARNELARLNATHPQDAGARAMIPLYAHPAPSDIERRLRRMLCAAKHGRRAYMDDGEASDSSAHPSIDYLRDSLDEIEAKWRQRAALAEGVKPAPSEPSKAMVAALRMAREGYASEEITGLPVTPQWRARVLAMIDAAMAEGAR